MSGVWVVIRDGFVQKDESTSQLEIYENFERAERIAKKFDCEVVEVNIKKENND